MRYNDGRGEEHAFLVPSEAEGTRLDVYLARHFHDASRTFIKRLIDDGLVRVEPGKEKPSYKLRGGETVTLFMPELIEMSAEPEAIALDVLHEDDALIVINKPSGMVVHPSPGHETGTLVNALLDHCHDLSGIGGVLRPGIVHRLDRDTTGCIVAAKTDAAHQWLSAQFSGRAVSKTYLAITAGAPNPENGTVEGLIGRHPRHRQLQAMLQEGGRYSLTLYRTVEHFGSHALVECDIKTGRTHQIRVHMKHQHAPILCDSDYGKGGPFPPSGNPTLNRQALHAWKLSFVHPTHETRMEFESPLPSDMTETLELLRRMAT